MFYGQVDDVEKAYNFLSDRFKNKESLIFNAYVDSKIVGFTQVYPTFSSVSAKRIFVLNDLFVRKNYRSLGVGECLIKAIIEHAQKEKIETIIFKTGIDNKPAERLYQKIGFHKDVMDTYSLKCDKNDK